MDAQFVSRRRVLVSRPRHQALGLLVADVLVSLHVARSSGAALVLLRSEERADSPLLRLRCSGITWIDPRSPAGQIATAKFLLGLRTSAAWLWVLDWRNHGISLAQRLFRFVHPRVNGFLELCTDVEAISKRRWNTFLRIVIRWCHTDRRRPLPAWLVAIEGLKFQDTTATKMNVRVRWKQTGGRVNDWLEELRPVPPRRSEVHHGFDIRELSLTQPLHAHLADEDEAAAAAVAADLGLDREKLVVLHVREGSTKATAGIEDRSKDTVRNADIGTFIPAIDEIVARGYTVVRIGDPSMRPLERAGVIDLATHQRRTQALELWCLARCAFFIASDSGPYLLSWLFEVPCLSVNITNTLGVFPLRPADRYLVKRLRDVATGQLVPLVTMLREDFIYGIRRRIFKTGEVEYVDNTPEEILAGVREMFDAVGGSAPPESEAQRRYAGLVRKARQGALSQAKMLEKTGSAEIFLGDGRVVHAFAAVHFDA